MLAWCATAVRDLVGWLFGLASGSLRSLAGLTAANALEQQRRIRTVLVTGANGYHASHVVRLLLEKGYVVRACVRDAKNVSSVEHLLRISSSSSSRSGGGRLELFSTGDVADKSLHGRYEAPLRGCDAVIHAATSPVSLGRRGRRTSWLAFDPVRDLITSGIESTKELLDSILKCKKTTIRCLVVTSSVSAAMPSPGPKVVDESCWSDDVEQLARGDYLGCLKTRQERLCREWATTSIDRGVLSKKNFRICAICPARLITGPPADAGEGIVGKHHFRPERWELLRWMTTGSGGMMRSTPSNDDDSVSVVHVRDCAEAHVAAMENNSEDASSEEGEEGVVVRRYVCVGGSMHWNGMLKTLGVLYPAMPLDVDDEVMATTAVPLTQFDTRRLESLMGRKPTGIKEIFAEMVEFFQSAGALK